MTEEEKPNLAKLCKRRDRILGKITGLRNKIIALQDEVLKIDETLRSELERKEP